MPLYWQPISLLECWQHPEPPLHAAGKPEPGRQEGCCGTQTSQASGQVKHRDVPETGDGAPPVPEQAPARQASIVGGDVSPHAGIPVLHIHHNHLHSSPGHGRTLWPRDLDGPRSRAGAMRRTRTAALVMAGGCGHDNSVARVVVLAPCAGSTPTCRAGPAGSSGYGPIHEH